MNKSQQINMEINLNSKKNIYILNNKELILIHIF